MKDEFADSRLPDLPNAGYASPKEKATSDLVMFWLRNIERDRLCLLAIVSDGRDKWMKVAGKAWGLDSGGRTGALTTDLLQRVFDYMVLLAGPNPWQQLLTLLHQQQQQFVQRFDGRQRQRAQARKQLQNALAELEKYGPR